MRPSPQTRQSPPRARAVIGLYSRSASSPVPAAPAWRLTSVGLGTAGLVRTVGRAGSSTSPSHRRRARGTTARSGIFVLLGVGFLLRGFGRRFGGWLWGFLCRWLIISRSGGRWLIWRRGFGRRLRRGLVGLGL